MSPTGGKNKQDRKEATAAEITEASNLRAFIPEVSIDENNPTNRSERSGHKQDKQ